MLRIEYDGKPLDVDPDELPGFYFALQDLIDLSALKGSRSTTMRLPASPQVRTTMGGVSMAEDEDGSFRSFRVMDGTAPVFSGVAKVLSRSRDEYEVVAIGDNAAWKDGAAALRLRELELGFTVDVDSIYQQSTWQDEESLVYFPLISYGALKGRANTYDVQPVQLRPALRVWWLLKYGFAKLGYSLEAKRGLLATCKKFVLPNTTSDTFSLNTDPDDIALRMFQTQDAGPREYSQSIAPFTDPIPDGVQFPEFTGNFYQAPGRYVPTSDGYVAVSMRFNFNVDLWTGPVNGAGIFFYTLTYVVFDYTDNVVKASVTRNYNSGALSNEIDDAFINFGTFEVVDGHVYGIGVYSDQWDSMNSGDLLNGYVNGAVTVYDATESRWLSSVLLYTEGKPLDIASAAPDITLLELLKWWTINQNIVVRTDEITKHITLEYYDDFCRPASEGVDWTYRLDHTDPPRKVTDTLPKAYQFRFAEDSKDQLVEIANRTRIGSAPYGGHDHLVPNGQESPQVVDIGFAPTAMDSILGGLIYVPALYDNGAEADLSGFIPDEYDWQPRLLYADGLASGRWIYDGVEFFEYPRCYFIWPESGRANISFGNETAQGSVTAGTVATRWRDRLRRSTAPSMEGFMRLYDHELLGFEFGRPVSINDGEHVSWFYVIEIKRHQFLADATTEVKLVRM